MNLRHKPRYDYTEKQRHTFWYFKRMVKCWLGVHYWEETPGDYSECYHPTYCWNCGEYKNKKTAILYWHARRGGDSTEWRNYNIEMGRMGKEMD